MQWQGAPLVVASPEADRKNFRNPSEVAMVDDVMIYALGPFRLDTKGQPPVPRKRATGARSAGACPVARAGGTARGTGFEGRTDRSRMARPGGRGEQPHGSDRVVAQGPRRGSRRRPLDRDHAPSRLSLRRPGCRGGRGSRRRSVDATQDPAPVPRAGCRTPANHRHVLRVDWDRRGAPTASVSKTCATQSRLFNVASRKRSIATADLSSTSSAMPRSSCLAIPWRRNTTPSRRSVRGSHYARRSALASHGAGAPCNAGWASRRAWRSSVTSARGASEDREIVGDAPNLAMRLRLSAQPGIVAIEPVTRRLIGGLFDCRDLGTIDSAGGTEPVRAWRVLGESRHREPLRGAARADIDAAGRPRGGDRACCCASGRAPRPARVRSRWSRAKPASASRASPWRWRSASPPSRISGCAISARPITRTARCFRSSTSSDGQRGSCATTRPRRGSRSSRLWLARADLPDEDVAFLLDLLVVADAGGPATAEPHSARGRNSGSWRR